MNRKTKTVLVAVVLALVACAGNQTANLSPAGHVAYTADQIAVRVNELQNAAIQAEASGALSTDTTRQIVQFALAANNTLATTPEGWPATITSAWISLKQVLPPITNPAVAAALSAVDVVLAVYMGG